MKIISVFNHYLERGGEAVAVEIIRDSLSRTHTVESCEFFSAEWNASNRPAQWKQALWTIYNPRSIKRIRNLQKQFRADCWLIHNLFPVGSLGIYSCAKRLRIPVVGYIHNFRPFSVTGYLWAGGHLAPGGLSKNYWEEIRHAAWQTSHLKTAWLAFVFSLGHLVGSWKDITWIAVSEFMREKFISAGVPAGDIFTLRHFWKPESDCDQQGNPRHFLYMGRLDETKGVSVLLKAWEILEKERGSAVPILIIAGNGPLRPIVEEWVAKLKSVQFVGVLTGDAKKRALKESKAVIVPSIWWEPLGLVVYEAYDYGLPVLAAASGGLPEIVFHGQTGLLHDPANPDQLARQISEIEDKPSLAREMGRRGRDWLERNADEKDWQKAFSTILNHALHKAT